MSNIKVFENKKVRTQWDSEKEDWWFSVVDAVEILTDSADYQTARNYWKVLKNRLKAEGSELVTFCNRLKLTAKDARKSVEKRLGQKVVSTVNVSDKQSLEIKELKKTR